MASIMGNILSGVKSAATAVAKELPDAAKKFTNPGPSHEFSGAPYDMAYKARQSGMEGN